jgi:hypothetical protein
MSFAGPLPLAPLGPAGLVRRLLLAPHQPPGRTRNAIREADVPVPVEGGSS